jgi:hypothetical protein
MKYSITGQIEVHENGVDSGRKGVYHLRSRCLRNHSFIK